MGDIPPSILSDGEAMLEETLVWDSMEVEKFLASFLEMQLYNMRHVQEHASQLNLLLGQQDVTGLDWVTQAREKTA